MPPENQIDGQDIEHLGIIAGIVDDIAIAICHKLRSPIKQCSTVHF